MSRNYKTDTVALRKLMIDNGIITITELADRSGVSRNTVSGVLSGELQPSADVMFKIASALCMEPQVAGSVFFAINLRNT